MSFLTLINLLVSCQSLSTIYLLKDEFGTQEDRYLAGADLVSKDAISETSFLMTGLVSGELIVYQINSGCQRVDTGKDQIHC